VRWQNPVVEAGHPFPPAASGFHIPSRPEESATGVGLSLPLEMTKCVNVFLLPQLSNHMASLWFFDPRMQHLMSFCNLRFEPAHGSRFRTKTQDVHVQYLSERKLNVCCFNAINIINRALHTHRDLAADVLRFLPFQLQLHLSRDWGSSSPSYNPTSRCPKIHFVSHPAGFTNPLPSWSSGGVLWK